MAIANHEDHFETADPEIRERLRHIQAEVESRVPDAVRCIGYGMPAFRRRRIFFYFASFKKHIGIYPPLGGPDELVERLSAWRGPKGNLSFPHAQSLPLELIGEVAEALAQQYGS